MSCVVHRLILRYCIFALKPHRLTSKNIYVRFKYRSCNNSQRFYCSSSLEDNSNTPDDLDFDEETPSYLEVDMNAITNGDPEKVKKFKLLQLELDLLSQNGEHVPSQLTVQQWSELLKINGSKSYRIKYLRYLWLNETKKRHSKERKAESNRLWAEKKALEPLSQPVLTTSSSPIYKLGFTSLFHRIYETQINKFYNYKLLQAMMFGPRILVDCSYEPFMTPPDMSNCVKQILLMWSENRNHSNPFDILFCNVNPDSYLMEKLSKFFPDFYGTDFPFNTTPLNYLDLYPKNKLVYLTPHCNNDLIKFNKKDIYIIGGFVDKSRNEPLSFAKAKKENLRVARFPLDKYLNWSSGIKSLTLNHSLGIMNEIKDGRSWFVALDKHIPIRKVTPKDEFEMEKLGNRINAKRIRNKFRRNLVTDFLMKEK